MYLKNESLLKSFKKDQKEFATHMHSLGLRYYVEVGYNNLIGKMLCIRENEDVEVGTVETLSPKEISISISKLKSESPPVCFVLQFDSYVQTEEEFKAIYSDHSLKDIFEGAAGFDKARSVKENFTTYLVSKDHILVITSTYRYSHVDGFEFEDAEKFVVNNSEGESIGEQGLILLVLKEMCR